MQELDSTAEFDAAHDGEFFAVAPGAACGVFRRAARGIRWRETVPAAHGESCGSASRGCSGPPDPASKRLNLREFAARVRYRVVGSPFELSFLALAARAAAVARGLSRAAAAAAACRAQSQPDERVSALLRHAAHQRERILFRAVRVAPRGGRVRFRFSRPVQDPPLPDQDSPRSQLSRLHLFGNENVPCAVLRGMHEGRVRRGSGPRRRVSGDGRRLAHGGTRARARGCERSARFRARRRRPPPRSKKPREALRGLPELARRLEDFNAVVLQRAAEENTVAVFVVRAGRIEEPRMLRFAELASEPRSVEQILREWLEGAGEQASPPAKAAASQQSYRELEDQLSLLARWFHKKPRAGEIFFRESDGALFRRRAAGRGQRAPQQRMALSPHLARLLAFARAADSGESSRQLTVES